jgi:hypothetical protein
MTKPFYSELQMTIEDAKKLTKWIGAHLRPIIRRSDGKLIDFAVSAPALLRKLAVDVGVPYDDLQKIVEEFSPASFE